MGRRDAQASTRDVYALSLGPHLRLSGKSVIPVSDAAGPVYRPVLTCLQNGNGQHDLDETLRSGDVDFSRPRSTQ